MNKFRLYWDIISPTLGILFISAIMFFVVGLVLSIPLCLLWNWLMPFIFGLPKLNLLQTFYNIVFSDQNYRSNIENLDIDITENKYVKIIIDFINSDKKRPISLPENIK